MSKVSIVILTALSPWNLKETVEQESYIQRLAERNGASNANFITYLFALPAVAALPYLISLFSPKTSLLSIIALTSLGCTGYLLSVLPPTVTGIAPVDAWSGSGGLAGGLRSPIDTHLPYLNAGLSVMLVLMELVASMKTNRGGLTWFGMGYLPGIVYGAVIVSKLLMGGVDPEAELSKLRYGYRGA